MPLGKLSKQQIAKGFEALEAIETALQKQPPSQKQLEELSSRFYTIIPHNFGRARPPPISTQEVVQAKKDMLLVRSSEYWANPPAIRARDISVLWKALSRVLHAQTVRPRSCLRSNEVSSLPQKFCTATLPDLL